MGLHGVDENGNLLSKDHGGFDDSEEEDMLALPHDYKSADQISQMGMMDVQLFMQKSVAGGR